MHPADVAPRVGVVGEEFAAAEARPLRRPPRPRHDLQQVARRAGHDSIETFLEDDEEDAHEETKEDAPAEGPAPAPSLPPIVKV